MDYKKQFGKKIVALLLFGALMLPTAIQFTHIFEGHDHIACSEKVTHVHKSVIKCEICDFNLASFDFGIIEYIESLQRKIPTRVKANFASFQYHSFNLTNTQLRAPPIFS